MRWRGRLKATLVDHARQVPVGHGRSKPCELSYLCGGQGAPAGKQRGAAQYVSKRCGLVEGAMRYFA